MKKLLIALILFTSCSQKMYVNNAPRTLAQKNEDNEKIKAIVIMGVVGYVGIITLLGSDFFNE